MPELVAAGASITLDAFFSDQDGVAADPVDPKVSIVNAEGTTVVNLANPTAHPAVGHHQYTYVVPEGGPLGAWEATWLGLVDGIQTGPVEDGFTVVAASSLVPPSPDAITCSPWASEDDLCAPCSGYDDAVSLAAADMIQAASDLLYEMSGRKYPGICTTVVRPCAARPRYAPMRSALPDDYTQAWGSCSCSDACGCPSRTRVELGAYPITDILQVTVDGVVLDPSLYRLDDRRTLVRLPNPDGSNPGWPMTQRLDLDDSEVGTWSVAFSWGRNPPPAGTRAAAVLACELAMSCDPDLRDECRLAPNATTVTREGVTVTMTPSSFLDATGKTGLWEVDLFLNAENPDGRRRQSSVWWPGSTKVVRPG